MFKPKLCIFALGLLLAAQTLFGATPGTQPRDMKLLVVTVDGTEPAFQAITFFLDYLGLPYQTVLAKTQPLPPLSDAAKGYYQGIILANGNLGICDATGCHSALSANDWTTLDAYTINYKVRLVAYYAWPEARYGLTAVGALSTSDASPATASFTSAASTVFPYLNTANPLKIANAYLYLAKPAPAAGETTTPLLTVQGNTVAALHTKPDGREYLAMTVDHNPYLLHSLAVNYGVFNWVTKGIFLGSRKIYLNPQMDDFFLSNDLFVKGLAACMPGGFQSDPTSNASDACPTVRITSGDLDALLAWQAGLNSQAQFSQFRLTIGFNGMNSGYGDGDYGLTDPLTIDTKARKSNFFWVSHTYDHEDLDCYAPVPNSGICTPANLQESLDEIALNVSIAQQLGLPLDASSMITPGISGLKNPAFLQAAKQAGLKYLVSDTSQPGGLPTVPNTGIRNPIDASILEVPRRPTNVFYNTTSGHPGADGSLPDEYNYFFGPSGLFKMGNGAPFFPTNQTLANIVDSESNNLLTYMLRYEIYPTMWHQSNFARYSGNNSLFTEVVNAAIAKYKAISKLPVISLKQSDIGKELDSRMGYLAAQVKATLYPGQYLTIGGTAAATVPVTGICKTGCESYGGQSISKIPIAANATITVPVN
jgi:hypothetical protein